MGLASLFDQISADLAAGEQPKSALKSPTFPTPEGDRWETQPSENKSIPTISRISHGNGDGTEFPENENAQARARERAGEGAREVHSGVVGNVGNRGNARRIKGLHFPHPYSQVGNVGKGAPPSASPSPDTAAFDERAGFLEYDCGLSREAAERQARAEIEQGTLAPAPTTTTHLPDRDGLALWLAGFDCLSLHKAPCPGYRSNEWVEVYARARSFLDTFGEKAEALGWTASRLFGAYADRGIIRPDACGALVLPIGGPVLAITATEIRFAHHTHREKPGQPEGVPLWALAA